MFNIKNEIISSQDSQVDIVKNSYEEKCKKFLQQSKNLEKKFQDMFLKEEKKFSLEELEEKRKVFQENFYRSMAKRFTDTEKGVYVPNFYGNNTGSEYLFDIESHCPMLKEDGYPIEKEGIGCFSIHTTSNQNRGGTINFERIKIENKLDSIIENISDSIFNKNEYQLILFKKNSLNRVLGYCIVYRRTKFIDYDNFPTNIEFLIDTITKFSLTLKRSYYPNVNTKINIMTNEVIQYITYLKLRAPIPQNQIRKWINSIKQIWSNKGIIDLTNEKLKNDKKLTELRKKTDKISIPLVRKIRENSNIIIYSLPIKYNKEDTDLIHLVILILKFHFEINKISKSIKNNYNDLEDEESTSVMEKQITNFWNKLSNSKKIFWYDNVNEDERIELYSLFQEVFDEIKTSEYKKKNELRLVEEIKKITTQYETTEGKNLLLGECQKYNILPKDDLNQLFQTIAEFRFAEKKY